MERRVRILITREAGRAAETSALVLERGWEPIVFPTIEICPPEDSARFKQVIARINDFTWVVFQSRSATEPFWNVLRELGQVVCGPRFAAVGDTTARALQALGVGPVLTPSRQDGEGLAEALCCEVSPGDRVLVLRAEGGRDVVAERLRARGVSVEEVVAYRTVPRKVPEDEVQRLLSGPRPTAALFMSPSAFKGYVLALGPHARAFLEGSILCAIGGTTAEAMKAEGMAPTLVSPKPSVEAALAAIAAVLRG